MPILCYTPEQIKTFIDQYEPQANANSYVFEDEQGRLTFCHYTVESSEARYINYIIPSVWEDRFSMVKATIQHLKTDFLTDNLERELRMHIDEKLPSHNAYYAGLLSEFGFKLRPRVTMLADQSIVSELTLPELDADFQEMAYDASLLETAISVYIAAHDANAPDHVTEEEFAREHAWATGYITKMFGLERTVQTWVGLGYRGELVGFAFGGVWDNQLSLDEVALSPAYHGQGLGRYLTIRFLQKIAQAFGGPNKYFFLGADRTNTQALKLYHRLGFKIDKIELYADLENPKLM